jgi:hypothetical protein
MGFRVDPERLRAAARDLTDAAQDAETTKTYVHKHGDLPITDLGAVIRIRGSHNAFLTALDDFLVDVGRLLTNSATELENVAAYYRRIDLDAAADLDATLPPTYRPPLRDSQINPY